MTKSSATNAKKELLAAGYNKGHLTQWEKRAKAAGRRWRTYTNTKWRVKI